MKVTREISPITVSRRRFLKCAVRGTAAVALSSSLVASTKAEMIAAKPWTMRQSTSSIHYLHLPVEKACAEIAKLGFEAVDIWSAHAGCPHLDDVLARLGADGLKRVLQENKLQLFAFSVYRGGYRPYAQLLGDAGGGVAVRGSAGPCAPGELTSRMRQFLEGLKPEIELAEKHNAYLAIENHGHALLDSLDSFKALVDMNRSPRVGIALAPYHLQAGGVSVEETIEVCGKQLLFFYAWEKAPGVKQLPGHGPTDMKPWIAALAKVGYAGYVNPFMHGDLPADEMSTALAKSKKYLDTCWDAVSNA